MAAGSPWERFKSQLFDEPRLGLRVDLSRMDLPERALDERRAAFEAAFAAMDALEKGAIVTGEDEMIVSLTQARVVEEEEVAAEEEEGAAEPELVREEREEDETEE